MSCNSTFFNKNYNKNLVDFLKNLFFENSFEKYNLFLKDYNLFLQHNRNYVDTEISVSHLSDLIYEALRFDDKKRRKDSHVFSIREAIFENDFARIASILATHHRTFFVENCSQKCEKSYYAFLKNSQEIEDEDDFFDKKEKEEEIKITIKKNQLAWSFE